MAQTTAAIPPRSSVARPLGDRAVRARRLDAARVPGRGHVRVDGGPEAVGVRVGGRERCREAVAEHGAVPSRTSSSRPWTTTPSAASGGHVQVAGAARQHRVGPAPRRPSAGQGVHRPRQHAQPVHPPVRVAPPVAAGERLVPADGQVHGPSGGGQLARDLLPGRPRAHHEHRARRQPVRVAVGARVHGGHRHREGRHVRHAELPGGDDDVARRERPGGRRQRPAVAICGAARPDPGDGDAAHAPARRTTARSPRGTPRSRRRS